MRHENDAEDEEASGLLDTTDTALKPVKRGVQLQSFFLTISLLLNAFFAFLGLFSLSRTQEFIVSPSYEAGFASDLEPARKEIELQVKTFFGGVELTSEGHYFTDKGGYEYVGQPQPAIDEAWSRLLGGLNLDFDKKEVELGDSTFQWPESGFYFSGLDVYHSLHCLNRLRQAMYPDYYKGLFDSPTDPSRISHIGHCINQIRQSLQCHADLTPMQWKLVGSRIILKTDTRHTCRNFDKIHQWATQHSTQLETIQSILNESLIIVD